MANAETPHDVLLKLAGQFPKQLLKNPGFDLFLSKNLRFLAIYPPRVLCGLIMIDYCPEAFLDLAGDTEDTSVARALLMNPRTPRSALDQIRENHGELNITHEEIDLHVNSNVVERRGWYKQFQEYVLEYPWYAGRNINELKLFLSGSYPCWVKPAIVRNLPGEVVYGLAGNAEITWDIIEILAGCRERDITDEEAPYEESYYFSNFGKYTGWNLIKVMSEIARHPAMPGKFISKWANELPEYHYLLQYLAENPNASIALLKRLACSSEWETHSGVAGNKSIGKLPYKILAKMLQEFDPQGEVGESIATNPEIPPNYLTRLVKDGYLSEIDWYYAAQHPNASASMLAWLSKYGGDDVLHEVASNPNTPPVVLEKLFNEGHYVYVANNPNLPTKLLELFALNDEEYLRSTAARNPKTPPDLLKKLSHDKALGADIAANPEAPVSLLRKLATHKDTRVRMSLAKNISSPASVLKRLAQDKDKSVRMCAAHNLNLSVASFNTLAKDSGKRVRRWDAQSIDTPKKVLEQLACDRYAYVRSEVAENPATPTPTLCSLLFDADKDVCERAARNPNAAMLFNSTVKPGQLIEPELLQDIVRSRQPSLARFIAYLQPDCPVEALAKHSRSTEWRERCAIAMHPNTPLNIIEKLMDDGNRLVRAAALNRDRKKH
jgi:hypothetical protein